MIAAIAGDLRQGQLVTVQSGEIDALICASTCVIPSAVPLQLNVAGDDFMLRKTFGIAWR